MLISTLVLGLSVKPNRALLKLYNAGMVAEGKQEDFPIWITPRIWHLSLNASTLLQIPHRSIQGRIQDYFELRGAQWSFDPRGEPWAQNLLKIGVFLKNCLETKWFFENPGGKGAPWIRSCFWCFEPLRDIINTTRSHLPCCIQQISFSVTEASWQHLWNAILLCCGPKVRARQFQEAVEHEAVPYGGWRPNIWNIALLNLELNADVLWLSVHCEKCLDLYQDSPLWDVSASPSCGWNGASFTHRTAQRPSQSLSRIAWFSGCISSSKYGNHIGGISCIPHLWALRQKQYCGQCTRLLHGDEQVSIGTWHA